MGCQPAIRWLLPLALAGLAAACTGVRPPVSEAAAAAPPDPSGGAASSAPPGGLAASQVPQFVLFGFDDNAHSGMPGSPTSGGIRWVVDLFAGRRNPAGRGEPRTFDGAPALTSFYVATRYIESVGVDQPEYVKRALRAAAEAGHEIGLHTHEHRHGRRFRSAEWRDEIDACTDWLARPYDATRVADATVGLGVPPGDLVGFRTPFLEWGPPLFPALRQAGIAYDCSVEVGFEDQYHGGNLPWPYPVAAGYGDNDAAATSRRKAQTRQRELWELPVYAFVVPADADCERYGVPPGLRERLHRVRDYFRPEDGKITGFDWNLWVEFQMSAPEVVATFRHTLDLRLAGNRAPLTFGTHSDIYSDQYTDITGSTAEERRQALRQILDEALARPEVRVVTGRQLLAWLRSPAPL